MPEPELVRRFRVGGRRGDEAYSELVERHQASVVRLVGYLLGGFKDAEDVAQEAFVRGFTHRDGLRDEHRFAAWIRVIATRVAFNHRRESATRKRYHDQLDGGEPSLPDASAEARDLLANTLSQMSYAYREILVLRYVEELTLSEIGTVLNLGESATKMRLARAKDSFREQQRRSS